MEYQLLTLLKWPNANSYTNNLLTSKLKIQLSPTRSFLPEKYPG
jgi:hypothetical protein